MTRPTTLAFGDFLILLGNGANPEVFTAPCGLTSKGFNQSASTQESTVPDCDNPDAPAYTERDIDALSAEISGSGVLAMESAAIWQVWYDSGLPKNVQIKLDQTLANHGGYWSGAFVLTGFNITGERGAKVKVDLTMQSDGAFTWNPASA